MKILIVRLSALGDIVHAVPAVAAIRARYPEARIDWLVDVRYAAVLRYVHGIDERITIDLSGWRGTVAAFATWARSSSPSGRASGLPDTPPAPPIRRLRAAGYDIAVDFQGLLKSAALARLSGAHRVVGFDRAVLREPLAARFYTERYALDDRQHVIRKNLELAAGIGADPSFIAFPMEVPASPLTDSSAYAVLNPGAGWPNKRWPPDRFGAVAVWMRDRFGWRSLVLWGPREQQLAQQVVDASWGAAVFAPRTGIGDVLALARDARVFVSGDTGPLHLATAMRTPVVGLYGPTSPDRNGPFDPVDICVSRFADCICHHERRCRRGRPCIESIEISEVQQAIERRVAVVPVPGTP
jgi:lipopolysaccharide heptosyltransferase I